MNKKILVAVVFLILVASGIIFIKKASDPIVKSGIVGNLTITTTQRGSELNIRVKESNFTLKNVREASFGANGAALYVLTTDNKAFAITEKTIEATIKIKTKKVSTIKMIRATQ